MEINKNPFHENKINDGEISDTLTNEINLLFKNIEEILDNMLNSSNETKELKENPLQRDNNFQELKKSESKKDIDIEFQEIKKLIDDTINFLDSRRNNSFIINFENENNLYQLKKAILVFIKPYFSVLKSVNN